MFKITYTNRFGKQFKLNVDDSNIEFEYGYAVVVKELTEIEQKKISFFNDSPSTLMGAVNEKFETIIPFTSNINNIEIFPNNNFIISSSSLNDALDFPMYYTHVRYNNEKLETIKELPEGKHQRISSTHILITNNQFAKSAIIYGVDEGKYLSEKFSNIAKFSKENNQDEILALAEKEIKTANGLSSTLFCYIDLNGKIRSKIYDSFTGEYMDLNSSNITFSDYVTNIKEKLVNKEEQNKNNLLALKKTIR